MTETREDSLLLSDVKLARRLEKAEGQSCAGFAEARAKAFPNSGAQWIEVAGAYAVYDGVDSPVTQTFGLGMFERATPAALEQIEGFFRARAAPVFHEVCPLADPGLTALLNERGYQPIEFTSVMYRPLKPDGEFALPSASPPAADAIHVRAIREDEYELWAQTATEGWSELPELKDFMLDLARINTVRSDAVFFLAERSGRPIATAALVLCEGVAQLAGASTIPAGRKQGAQLGLLAHRLRYAAEKGCDVAMICAQPGSGSQRNAERRGFRIAYTRIKWHLARPAAGGATPSLPV